MQEVYQSRIWVRATLHCWVYALAKHLADLRSVLRDDLVESVQLNNSHICTAKLDDSQWTGHPQLAKRQHNSASITCMRALFKGLHDDAMRLCADNRLLLLYCIIVLSDVQ